MNVIQTSVVVLVLISLNSCAYGPATKASGLEKLNGANYESSATATGTINQTPVITPFIKRRETNTQISGKLLFDQEGIPTPLARQMVQIVQEGKVLATVVTESDGTFRFSLPLPDGSVEIRVNSDRYQGSLTFYVQGFNQSDLQLMVKKS